MFVLVKKEKIVIVILDKEMFFFVLFYRVWKKYLINVDFLGIYIFFINKFSFNVYGLIGKVLINYLISVGLFLWF